MAMDKDEIDKYVFDPENPRNCKYYKRLLGSTKKDAYWLFSTDFFLYLIDTLDIFKKDFEDELQIDDYDITDFTIDDFEDIDKNKYIEEFKKKYYFIKNIANFFTYNRVNELWFNSLNPLEQYLGDMGKKQEYWSKTTTTNYKERCIIFSNCIEFAQFRITKSSVFITLEENRDEFYKKERVKNLYPIFLEKMEDLEVLLKTLKEDLDQIKRIESHKFGYLGAIQIENYFSIKNMEITNLKNKKEIYFVGENGDGKTILLQAILLALKKEYSGQIIEYIRPIEKNMELSVKDEFAQDYSKDKNISNVFAYGINRNKVRKKFDEYGYSGLFDTSDFKDTTFLKEPEEILKSGEENLIDEFIEKFNEIILQESVKVEKGDREFIFKEDNREINFDKLSEGYKSTIIWLFDLVSRLIENIEKNDDIIKELKDFKAIVLIDEVDLYLHPKWKYDFVYNLRKVFPNIQFIMITHSAVTILGASTDAVFYRIYKENGETKISNQIPNRGYTSNTVISSPLFDLDSMTSRHYDKRKLSEDDYVYEKIHEVVSQKIKEDINLDEEAILKLIEEEFAKHEKN